MAAPGMLDLSGACAAGRKKRRAVQPGQEQEEEGSPPPDEDPMRALVQYNQAPSSFRDADFSQQFLGLLAREGHAPTPPHSAGADSGGADAPRRVQPRRVWLAAGRQRRRVVAA